MSDFMKALDKYMAENADLEQAIETINKMAEALLYALQQHEGRLTPMHNDWSAGAREAIKLAEPYIRGK